jgi:hypothetical protein
MKSSSDEILRPVTRVLKDARAHRHDALVSYHDPETFQRSVEALVQDLRNVTFRLQSVKSNIGGFDAWYEPRQNQMREDEVLRWLSDARVDVVHKAGLRSSSFARVSVIDSYLEAPTVVTQLPVDLSTEELVGQTISALPPAIRQHLTIEIRRRWEAPSLPGLELLFALAHCYVSLYELIEAVASELLGEDEPVAGLLMTGDDWEELLVDASERFIQIKADTCEQIEVAAREIDEIPDLETASSHYGIDLASTVYPLDAMDRAKASHEKARAIFNVDGYHVLLAILSDSGGRQQIIALELNDKRDKFLAMRRVAEQVVEGDFDLVVVTGESWLTPAMETPQAYLDLSKVEDKREALITWAESKDGRATGFASMINRHESGVTLDEAIVVHSPVALLDPIRRAWAKMRVIPGEES